MALCSVVTSQRKYQRKGDMFNGNIIIGRTMQYASLLQCYDILPTIHTNDE